MSAISPVELESNTFLEPPKQILVQIPVVRLNFYLMGAAEVTDENLARLTDNVKYLNEEFEGKVKFEVDFVTTSLYTAYLPDLRMDFFVDDGSMVDHLTNPIEIEGAVNIFVFDTYAVHDRGVLMGFTPIISAEQKKYEALSPQFDRIFLSYESLDKRSTLIHEMGHFLGLSHPWEMTDINKVLMGLQTAESQEENHMSYSESVSTFTPEQLERMRDFALNFRFYLLKKVEYSYIDDLYAYQEP